MPMRTFLLVFLSVAFLSSCTIIRPGEVGVKRKLGVMNEKIHREGPVTYFPFTTRVLKVPTRTINVELNLDLPSKEGVNVNTTVSILYHIIPDSVPRIIETVGLNFEEILILSVFRSKAADVTSQFLAKDLHSGERSFIELGIRDSMNKILTPRGFIIEQVLMKSIKLPPSLSKAIEDKLAAEQDAQRMEFVLQRERQEAERKKIEASGIRDAQLIIAQSLNDTTLRYMTIEAFRELAKSPNAKVIITDGKPQLMVDPNAK